MTTPTKPDAFGDALERAADADVTYADDDVALAYKLQFACGARWAREWILANDPMVRALVEALEKFEAHVKRGYPTAAEWMALEDANRKALKAWKERCK